VVVVVEDVVGEVDVVEALGVVVLVVVGLFVADAVNSHVPSAQSAGGAAVTT
jgi:hypothetical protein